MGTLERQLAGIVASRAVFIHYTNLQIILGYAKISQKGFARALLCK